MAPDRSRSAPAKAPCESHAVEAIVGRGDGGREHLALGTQQGGAGEIVDEQFVGEAAEMEPQPGRQPHGRDDARRVGQTADDRCLLGTTQTLFIASHWIHSSLVGDV